MKDFISWQVVDECVTEIAFHLKDTGKDFVGVFGIRRGCVILAVMLSHKLDIPYITEFWRVGDGDIVVIDDIADTGKTLQWYKKQPETKDAHYVTIHDHEQSIVKPDYSVLYKQDKWIVYPWEAEESEEVQDYLR